MSGRFLARTVLIAGAALAAFDAAGEAGRAETPLIELRFEEIRSCVPPGERSKEKIWMGASIRARAKTGELFVTPRDFTLERGGIILAARHVDPPALPRCLPLLPPKQLRARQSLRGFVLFEVPAIFRAGDVPLVLAYRPTVWGGARRIELRVPPCLDACPSSKSRSTDR